MNQIYYTQCPIGYGLGASNGFQIKRLSPGYVLSGDFRHLGLRAFLPASRTLAPPALRYRRGEGGLAEIAWLTPRSHEYETERGNWGRPGGHFAHGLQLDDAELAALSDWPAGLFDRPFWTRTDPEPSRGLPPGPLGLSASDLRSLPTFEAIASLVEGERNAAGIDRLARLLTALARVAREGRTLFLIDDASNLAERIALLTFAFPPPWRGALTFSTYHDRPEELPGFRLQGTVPSARPNRAALSSQGIVVDLVADLWEPEVPPESWALTLAGWLNDRGAGGKAAWEATAGRARRVRLEPTSTLPWTIDWLDGLFGFESLVASPVQRPADLEGWTRFARTAHWAARVGLMPELLEARPPSWWSRVAAPGPPALEALLAHVGQVATWKDAEAPGAWGAALAGWVIVAGPDRRVGILDAALRTAPSSARPGFVRALLGALPGEIGSEVLDWLKSRPECDAPMLLPLEIPGAVVWALERQDPHPLRDILADACPSSGTLAAVLDALEAEARSRPGSLGPLSAELAVGFEGADPLAKSELIRWALRRGDDAGAWLAGIFRRSFADPLNQDAWRALTRSVPQALRPALARTVLPIAIDPGLPDEAFRWAVEELLLPLSDADRPHDPSWPGAYLDRTPSGLDLLRRLFTREYRHVGVKRWLDRAQARGELSTAQWERVEDCEHYARALKSGEVRSLLDVKLPDVPPEQRGALLGQILGLRGDAADEALKLAVDTCREAWPGAFEPGAPGLEGLARSLAGPLLAAYEEPATWYDRVVRLLDRLGLGASSGHGFEPDGFAAALVAQTTRRELPGLDPWKLREFVLREDAAWRCLAADVRADLEGIPPGDRIGVFELWDRKLARGLHSRRFFEVWSNACDGPTLAALVSARAVELKSLGVLSWWDHARHAGARDDIREAFARLAPLAPLEQSALPAVAIWLGPERRPEARPELVPLKDEAFSPRGPSERGPSPLSPVGLSRWRCIEALTKFGRAGLDTQACWQTSATWKETLPLDRLDPGERHRFLAWLIRRLDESESFQVARLAKWLVDCGVTDVDRIGAWADELEGIVSVDHATRLARAPMVSDLRVEIKNVIKDLRSGPRKARGGDSP